MREITFSEADVQAISHDRYHYPDPRVQRHMEVLWLKHHGFTHEDIALLAGGSRSTVQRTLTAYLEGGLARIRQAPGRQAHSELDDHRDSLEEVFSKQPPRSTKEAAHLIEQHTGLRRGLTQVRRFMRRLGMRPLKTIAVPIPPKSSLEEHVKAQAKFLEDELEPRLEEARQGRRRLYFVDASHFVFATLLGVVWCWARQAIRAASGRKRYNVLAALDGVSHKLICVSNHSCINADSVCLLLRAVAEAALPGLPITLVLDNARYQKCALAQGLAKQLGIELLYLPSYSPNLNLIERVWRFVRKESLNSTYYESFEPFTTAIDQCLDGLSTVHRGEMETLLTHEFQMFGDVPLLAA